MNCLIAPHILLLDTEHSFLIAASLSPIHAQVGFKMYLGVAPTVTNWNQEKTECSLIFDELPFADFVELPQPQCSQLSYCSLICGVVEGRTLSHYSDAYTKPFLSFFQHFLSLFLVLSPLLAFSFFFQEVNFA